MKVPFLELKPTYIELKDELDAAYGRVMDSGWYLLGAELEAFEDEYAAFCATDNCVAVNSGLDALHLALRACGVGEGDEVIVPAHTFIATWLAVTYTGGRPVPVECDPATYNLDVYRVEAAITQRTRAIIPVHLYGQTADMDPIMEIAKRRALFVVEDAAQSQGADYKGRRSGGLGHIAAHSFYPAKNLGAFGDGGAVTTNDQKLANKLRLLRNYGSREKYHHEIAGFNSRMNELQAAFLRVKLKHLDEWNRRRQEAAQRYVAAFHSLPDLILPQVPDWATPVWHLFVVRHSRRDELQRRLNDAGVGTQIHYPIPPHLSGAYANQNMARGTFPVAEQLADTVLSLPIGPHLTAEQVRFVVDNVTSAASNLN
jgi:dTDP-3-amino-3,4,6-trideoxy-alpha-D-glucose transaminase